MHAAVHVTDVHHSVERVAQLKSWLGAKNVNFDVLLLSGDIANAPMDWSLTQEEQEKHKRDLEAVVDSFCQISDRVFYIPGNVSNFCISSLSLSLPPSLPPSLKCSIFPSQHDVLPVYKEAEETPTLLPTPPPSPCNMHMKQTTIAPKLHLLGLGGSVPGYRAGEMIWEGFPYKEYSDMDKDVHKLLDPVFFDDTSSLSADDGVILMTHVGPADSGMKSNIH